RSDRDWSSDVCSSDLGHLAELAEQIARVPHVQRLRIHTRLPIVIPQRVTTELIDWLRATRLTPMMVVHANHPQEIDDPTAGALRSEERRVGKEGRGGW